METSMCNKVKLYTQTKPLKLNITSTPSPQLRQVYANASCAYCKSKWTKLPENHQLYISPNNYESIWLCNVICSYQWFPHLHFLLHLLLFSFHNIVDILRKNITLPLANKIIPLKLKKTRPWTAKQVQDQLATQHSQHIPRNQHPNVQNKQDHGTILTSSPLDSTNTLGLGLKHWM